MGLSLKIEREVQPTEVAYLIHGTGIFGWAPWWQDSVIQRYADGGNKVVVVDDPCNNILAGDMVKIIVDDPDEAEGSGITKTFLLTLQQVIDAVVKAWPHLAAEAQRDMTEDLGLADAEAADIVMQYAVFDKIVYG